jgi:hypothetical protein
MGRRDQVGNNIGENNEENWTDRQTNINSTEHKKEKNKIILKT